MSYFLISEIKRVARIKHICIWCGSHILTGETYIYENSIYDRHWQNHKWHIECAKDCPKESEFEFSRYQNDRPKK